MRSLLLAVTLLPGLAAAQQAFLSPPAAATTLGREASDLPLGGGIAQYQQVHAATSMSAAGPASIGSLAFRMAANAPGTPGATVDVELFLGASALSFDEAGPTFAANVVAGTEARVLDRRTVSLPQLPDHRFGVSFPFDRPFAWNGGDLAWRMLVHGNGVGNAPFPYPLDSWNPSGDSAPVGPLAGCLGGPGLPPAVQDADVQSPGRSSSFVGHSFVLGGGVPTVFHLGLSPFQLDLGAVGAPGCVMTNDATLSVVTTTLADATGSARVSVSVPWSPALQGFPFFTQFAFVHAPANPLGVFTTNGLGHILGPLTEITRIDAPGVQSTTGTVREYAGVAVQFQ